jgi:hypothetical protein
LRLVSYRIAITTTDNYRHTFDVTLDGEVDKYLEDIARKNWFIKDGLAINMNQVVRIRATEKQDV